MLRTNIAKSRRKNIVFRIGVAKTQGKIKFFASLCRAPMVLVDPNRDLSCPLKKFPKAPIASHGVPPVRIRFDPMGNPWGSVGRLRSPGDTIGPLGATLDFSRFITWGDYIKSMFFLPPRKIYF